eukprot:1112907-Pyramimonas_sp.AAC.1
MSHTGEGEPGGGADRIPARRRAGAVRTQRGLEKASRDGPGELVRSHFTRTQRSRRSWGRHLGPDVVPGKPWSHLGRARF